MEAQEFLMFCTVHQGFFSPDTYCSVLICFEGWWPKREGTLRSIIRIDRET